MKRIWSKYGIVLVIVATVLVACGGEEAPVATQQPLASAPTVGAQEFATNTPEPTAVATDPPAPTETSAPTPTAEPTPTEEVVAEISDHCLACHSDKEQLVDTAAPEEKVPSESSGVG